MAEGKTWGGIYLGTEREIEGDPTDLTRKVIGKKTGPFPQPQGAP